MNHKRILFVLDYYLPHRGGMETMFSSLITGLLHRGYEIGIITTRHENSLPVFEQHTHLTIRRCGKNRTTFLRCAFRKTLLIGKSYDLLHTTTYAGALPAGLAGWLLQKPVVLTVHEVFGPLRKKLKPISRPFYRGFERSILTIAQKRCRIVAVSDYTKTCLIDRYHLPINQVHRIYNGVDVTLRTSDQKDDVFEAAFIRKHDIAGRHLLLYTGHPGCSKGIAEFATAIPVLCEKFPSLTVILNILPGKQRNTIVKKLRAYNDTNNVIIMEGVEQRELLTLILLSNAVVVPSLSEGFGLIAAEVSALRKPLIVSKKGALPEVVSGNVIFLDGHTPYDFSIAIEKSLSGSYTSLSSKEFSRQTTITQYIQVYQNSTDNP